VKTSVCVTGCCTPWMRAISVASRFTVALRFAMAITWCRRQRAMRVGLPVLFRQCRNSFVVDLDEHTSERFTLASLAVQTQL